MNKLKIRASVGCSAKPKNKQYKAQLTFKCKVLIHRFFHEKRMDACDVFVFISRDSVKVHSLTSARRPELITAVRTSC